MLAASSAGFQSTGFEINSILVAYARSKAHWTGVPSGQATFVQKDFWNVRPYQKWMLSLSLIRVVMWPCLCPCSLRPIYLRTTMWPLFLLQEWWVFLSLPVDLSMLNQSFSMWSIWNDWFSIFWLAYRWRCSVRSCWKSFQTMRVSSLVVFRSPTGRNSHLSALALTRPLLMTLAVCAHTWEKYLTQCHKSQSHVIPFSSTRPSRLIS